MKLGECSSALPSRVLLQGIHDMSGFTTKETLPIIETRKATILFERTHIQRKSRFPMKQAIKKSCSLSGKLSDEERRSEEPQWISTKQPEELSETHIDSLQTYPLL
jgi:hypothetical protein